MAVVSALSALGALAAAGGSALGAGAAAAGGALLANAPAIASLGTLAATVGSTAYQQLDAAHTRTDAKAQAKGQKAEQDALLQEAKNKEANRERQTLLAAARDRASGSQQSSAASNSGRAGTLLTSPLGELGSTPGGAKTLLGL